MDIKTEKVVKNTVYKIVLLTAKVMFVFKSTELQFYANVFGKNYIFKFYIQTLKNIRMI